MQKRNRKSAARTKQITFTHELATKVTVKPAEFVYLTTLRYVDQTKLAKGTHRIDVGYLKAPCCKRMVTATVTRGTITRFDIEPCAEEIPAPREFKKVLKVALKKLGTGGKSPLPVSFADFAARTIEIGGLYPCGWIIVTPETQQGTVYFCCVKTIKVGPITLPYITCGALPFPPRV